MNKYIIVGKAASGKDWLQRRLVEKGYHPMKQYTTREIRETETGDEYYFISDDVFREKNKNGDFISANFYAIGWYGVSLDELNNSDVAILSPANMDDLSKKFPDVRKKFTVIYLDMPIEMRRERLSNRYKTKVGDDNESRIQADEKDFKSFINFDLHFNTIEEVNNFVNNL